jgi:hypothetical protein
MGQGITIDEVPDNDPGEAELRAVVVDRATGKVGSLITRM